jgi:hypothetical protein
MPRVRSGLGGLARGVRAYFLANDVTAEVRLGWHPRNRQDNAGPGGANRVVLIPGLVDPTSGAPKVLKGGRLDHDAPMNFHLDAQIRMMPRAWWHELVTCCVWAANPDRPTDEEAQIESVETLLELTIQALTEAVDPVTGYAAGFANLDELGDVSWTLPPGENAFGRELSFVFEFLVPLYDAAVGLAYPQPAIGRNPAA